MSDRAKARDESAEAAYAAMGFDLNVPYLGEGIEVEGEPEPEAAQNTAELKLTIAHFSTAMPKSAVAGKKAEAIGKSVTLTWLELTKLLQRRRQGQKDGSNLVYARFRPEPNGSVRRLKSNVAARTAIALDCETNKKTGEVPPSPPEAAARIKARGWAGVVYTSHSHAAEAPRFRIVVPLTDEIAHLLPSTEVIADLLQVRGVLDESKLGASSVFYLPSANLNELGKHEVIVVDGAPIDAGWLTDQASALQVARDTEQARERAEALASAEKRRAERIASGATYSEGLIEKIREKLDLERELLAHGYEKCGDRYLYPGSETGVPGVFILRGSDGVERAFSHHAGDPLAPGNHPSWCRANAVDAVDVAVILDHRGELKKGLHELAKRFAIREKKPEQDTTTEAGIGNWTGEVPPIGELGPARKAKPTDEQVWGEPVDFLADDNTAPSVLEGRHVPDALWPFVKDTADRMGSDPAAVALAALVCCASVISDEWTVQVRRNDTAWTEQARLWGAIVGAPSVKKTPVIRACSRPIDRLEVKANAEHKERMATWKALEAQAKADKTAPPPRPKLERYLTEGSTVEALSEVLRDDEDARFRVPCKKILSRQDEMSELIAGFDRYRAGGKGGSDRGAYLRLYNGGRYVVDRIARGSFAVSDWSACLLGGIQPEPIQRIARESADDGLLQRFSFCVATIQSAGIDRAPDQAADERYSALFPALVALRPVVAISSDHARPVVFHADAHQHREDIGAVARVMAGMPDMSVRLKAALDKWPALFARLCLTFHMIEVADARARNQTAPFVQVIPEAVAAMVAGYMRDILLPHLLRAEALMFTTDQTSHARWIAGFILAKQLDRIAARDIMQAYKALRAPETKREMMAAMENLTALAWVEPDEPANPVKGVTSWTVNPAVH